MVVRPVWVILLLVLVPTAARGDQDGPLPSSCQVGSVADLPHCVRPNEHVVVTTAEGRRVRGTFRGYASDRVLMDVADVAGFASFADLDALEIAVVRLERSAGRMGEGIGGGLLFGLLIAAYGSAKTTGEAWGTVLGMGALGGVAGWLVPTSVERVVLDRASRSSAPAIEGASPPRAPRVGSTLAIMSPSLTPGDRLRVRQFDGAVVLGRYGSVEDGMLVVRMGDRVERVGEDRIGSVERLTKRRRSLKTGGAVGAVVVLGLFVLGSSIDTPGEPSEGLTSAEAIGGGLAAAGMGAAIGASVAWMLAGRESEVLFYRPRPATAGTGRGAAVAWRLSF